MAGSYTVPDTLVDDAMDVVTSVDDWRGVVARALACVKDVTAGTAAVAAALQAVLAVTPSPTFREFACGLRDPSHAAALKAALASYMYCACTVQEAIEADTLWAELA